MLIRILLLAFLTAIGYFVFLRRQKLPLHILVLMPLLGIAALFVALPNITNTIARFFGVGRGADLISYLVEIGLLFVVIHYYTKFVELQTQITRLVRELALLRAEIENRSHEIDPGKTP